MEITSNKIHNKKMKLQFALLYVLNLIKINPIKMVAIVLTIAVAPFLNSLEDIRNEDKIDYQYQKDGKYFYVTQGKSSYSIESFYKQPLIKDGYIITYSYDERNILIWFAFVLLLSFPVIGFFSGEDGFDLETAFQASISYYITCELEEGTYYYFYEDRFLGKSDMSLHNQYNHIARAFGINNMTTIKNCPRWKTKTQSRNKRLEEIGV
jgi:hypothetical protein